MIIKYIRSINFYYYLSRYEIKHHSDVCKLYEFYSDADGIYKIIEKKKRKMKKTIIILQISTEKK